MPGFTFCSGSPKGTEEYWRSAGFYSPYFKFLTSCSWIDWHFLALQNCLQNKFQKNPGPWLTTADTLWMPNVDQSPSGGLSEVMLCWILWLASNAFCEPEGLWIWRYVSFSTRQKSVFRNPWKLGLKNTCNLIPAKPSVFEQPRDSNSETGASGGTLMVYIKVMMFWNKCFTCGENNSLLTTCPKSNADAALWNPDHSDSGLLK